VLSREFFNQTVVKDSSFLDQVSLRVERSVADVQIAVLKMPSLKDGSLQIEESHAVKLSSPANRKEIVFQLSSVPALSDVQNTAVIRFDIQLAGDRSL